MVFQHARNGSKHKVMLVPPFVLEAGTSMHMTHNLHPAQQYANILLQCYASGHSSTAQQDDTDTSMKLKQYGPVALQQDGIPATYEQVLRL